MDHGESELLRKYLRGGATPSEERQIRKWLIENEANEDVSKLLKEEWMKTTPENELNIDVEKAWDDFKKKVNGPPGGRKGMSKAKSVGLFSGKQSLILVAASVAIMIATVSFFLGNLNREIETDQTHEITYNIKKTNRGEKLNLSLPDGSFIKLNSSTELRIPDDYGEGKERVVFLNGEAFFDVARDVSKPFKVISGNVTTEVLGTTFNVNTFSKQSEVSVAVVSGKVHVADDNNRDIILYPQEMTTFSPTLVAPTKKSFDADVVTGWVNNQLIFDKVSFDEIVERLEQWYGVEFIIEGTSHQTGRFSGRFENKSLQLVLDGLGFSSSFDYKVVDKKIYLKFK